MQRNARRKIVWAAALALVWTLATATAAAEQAGPLVDADWLVGRLGDPDICVIEIGRDLYEFEAGHIPGAAFIDVRWMAREADGVPGLLASPETLDVLLETAGVTDSVTVVVYDGASSLWAARLFWALEHLGHEDVRVLNGGWMRWTCNGHDVELGLPRMSAGEFTPLVRDRTLATREWIHEMLGDPGLLLLDVRTPEEYSGVEPLQGGGGRIPGAVHFEWSEALAADGSGLILPPEELESRLEAAGVAPGREVVTYCHVGARAAHTYLALRIVGHENARVYDGSWAEWGSDPNLPIEPPRE